MEPLCIFIAYNTLLRHFKAYDEAFDGYPHVICFAVKSNPNTAILRLFAKNGGGADIVSGGELYAALKAGVPSNKIVYAGVGKTEEEIRFALRVKDSHVQCGVRGRTERDRQGCREE